MSRTTKSLFLVGIVLLLLACQIPGVATPTTSVPEATEVSATEAPATEVTSTSTPEIVPSVMFVTMSPNGKRIAKLVSEDGGSTWNLVVDDQIRDKDVAQVRPVWTADSENLVMASYSTGVCYYDVTGITSNIPQFCYEEFPVTGTPVLTSDQYGDNLWFISRGDIYHVTPDWSDKPEKFTATKDYTYIDLALSVNGYYLAGTTDEGDTVVFETDGKFVRKYDGLTNCAWSIRSQLACVTLEGNVGKIVLVDITTIKHDVVINAGNLRPEDLSYSADGYKLLFYYTGAVYWLRTSDGLIFHVSDPNTSLVFNPSWHNGFIVYDQCVDMVCETKSSAPVTTMKWIEGK